jgi:DNA ligase 1
MADLAVGESMEMKGSGRNPYIIKNCGDGGYSCTCPAWRNQSIDPSKRTCKHIRKLRGDAAEEERIESAVPLPPRRAEGEAKESPVLLAESWDGESSITGWWMSEKLDGVRAYWDGKALRSRNNNQFLAPDWFVAGLPPVPLDGELWVARKKFQLAVGVAKSGPTDARWAQMRYIIYDAPGEATGFEARMRYLEEMFGKSRPEFVSILEQQECRDADHLRAELTRIESLGGEGLMLRQPGSLYEIGRSSTLLKVKRFHTAEARVIRYQAGEGKHVGRVGALWCELADGKDFRVGTGLSDAERASPPPIGSIIEFKYQELTDTGVPRFPSYVGVRLDRTRPTPLAAVPAVETEPASPRVSVGTPPAAPAPTFTCSQRLEYTSDGKTTFWEATVNGSDLIVRFGPLGSAGQSKTRSYASAAAAVDAFGTLVAEKREDGFTAPGAAPAVAAPSPSPAPATAVPGGTRRFEYVAGTSSKFWEVWVEDDRMMTRWGRIGSMGTTTVKPCADTAAAQKLADKKIAEKLDEGYVEK